jgi:hypothetical protein
MPVPPDRHTKQSHRLITTDDVLIQFDLLMMSTIDIIGRTQSAMIEAFNSLEKAAKDMNLFVNQEKTKYMPVTRRDHAHYPYHLEVEPYKFEVIRSFTYLGSNVSCTNDISEEIQKRILAANRCFHGLRKHLRSHLI